MVIDSSVEIKEDATPLAVTTTTTAGNSLSSSNFNAESFWQHIIALDVQFSSARCFGSYLSEWCPVYIGYYHCLMFPFSTRDAVHQAAKPAVS